MISAWNLELTPELMGLPKWKSQGNFEVSIFAIRLKLQMMELYLEDLVDSE